MSTDRKTIYIRLSDELKTFLTARAAELGVSLNAYICIELNKLKETQNEIKK